MTIVTRTEYRKNPSKYEQRAQDGERVIISYRGTYTELKPVSSEDKDVREHIKAISFLSISSSANKAKEDMLTFHTVEELKAHLASL